MDEENSQYPGDAMTTREVLDLADEFFRAAIALRKLHRFGEPESLSPFRLAALHAVELYLSAFLRLHGHENAEIRKSGHRVCEKAQVASEHGLVLRKGTVAHLHHATAVREYLVARYEVHGSRQLRK